MRPRRKALWVVGWLAALLLLAACVVVNVPTPAAPVATPTPTFPISSTVEEATPTVTPTAPPDA